MFHDAAPSALNPVYPRPAGPAARDRPGLQQDRKTDTDMCGARSAPLQTLFISGPNGEYRLGDPMLIHDLALLLGTIEAPVISRDRSIVHLGRFSPSPSVPEGQHRQFAPLLLVEAIMFVAQRFRDVGSVHFTLEPPVEIRDGEFAGALSRLALLERSGATDLQMTPGRDPVLLGSFVVQGAWNYSGFNLAALAAELFEQRALYARMRDAPATRQTDPAGRWLGRQWTRLKP
ncbi:hypothetical protein [Variovorax sp. OV329]|uniref:hypothetical protein n=1 Tax=Variovorax sp. OV329 TaxID=1882825 RepID=UPI0008E34357|nr:hypothetical protein [Variovorax sp. OV329]SFM04725.1 hypothetical protein SAMN05444747_102156 [Variovorax sp. OV329]